MPSLEETSSLRGALEVDTRIWPTGVTACLILWQACRSPARIGRIQCKKGALS